DDGAEPNTRPKSEGRRDGTFSKRCGLCGPWTLVESPTGTARRPAAWFGHKFTEPIDLLSATSDERILRRSAVQLSVLARDRSRLGPKRDGGAKLPHRARRHT